MLIYVTILHSLRKIALTPSILRKTYKIVAKDQTEPFEDNKIDTLKDRLKLNRRRVLIKDENVLFLFLLTLLIGLLMMHIILILKISSGFLTEYESALIIVTLNGMPHC